MILITGATGLLGSALAQSLVRQGNAVKALYRSAIPTFAGAEKIEWIKADILDLPALEDAMQNVRQVYHCAAVVSFNPNRVQELYKTNVEGTANIVNTCIDAGVGKLVYVSSVAALGRLNRDGEISENMQWTPESNNSEYGKSKYLAEMEVWRGIGEGLQAAIVNPSIILGAGNWDDGSSQIFKTVYKEFPWYTDGVTGFVDVEDVVQAMIVLMNSDVSAQRFILNEGNTPYKDLFTMIAECLNKKPVHKKVTPLIASVIWRVEALRRFFTGSNPLLTRETSASAQAKVYFNNTKFLQQFPNFNYLSLHETISRICNELKVNYQLI